MPKVKEFTVTIEDKPGALGRCFLALAERGINVLAFQSYVEEGESLARIVVDDPPAAKQVLGNLRMIFEETEAALVRLEHRPGELGRAAARLGEHKINIDYSYCGLEHGSTQEVVVFGVEGIRHVRYHKFIASKSIHRRPDHARFPGHRLYLRRGRAPVWSAGPASGDAMRVLAQVR